MDARFFAALRMTISPNFGIAPIARAAKAKRFVRQRRRLSIRADRKGR